MREIVFRGKTPDWEKMDDFVNPVQSTKWVYGDLIQDPFVKMDEREFSKDENPYLFSTIRPKDSIPVTVIAETIGQYTGLKDKNGEMIFDGDIVRSVHYKSNEKTYYIKHVCEWSEKYSGWFMRSSKHIGNIYFKHGDIQAFVYFNSAVDPEIIGNKYDNPELLR